MTATTMALKTTSHHNLAAVPPPSAVVHKSFYWGHDAQVLFTGWPGSSSSMYALAVLLVFFLAVLVEWVTHLKFMKKTAHDVSTVVLQTAVQAVRTGLSYMVMLSVMSFNGGIFLAAVGGHAVGFVLFRSRAETKTESVSRNGSVRF